MIRLQSNMIQLKNSFVIFIISGSIFIPYAHYFIRFPKRLIFLDSLSEKFFFGLVSVDSAYQRRKDTYNEWLKDCIESGHEGYFITDSNVPGVPILVKNLSLLKGGKNYSKDVDRAVKRVTAAQYFVQFSKLNFFWTLTDDVVSESQYMNWFVKYLSSLYSADSIVILGDCHENSKGLTWLQGGSGYIFNRQAAKLFVHYGERWIKDVRGPDDVELGKFLSYFGKTNKDCVMPHVPGHPFREVDQPILNISNIHPCPINYTNRFCGTEVYPLDVIYAIHPPNRMKGLNVWRHAKTLVQSGTGYYFFLRNQKYEFCYNFSLSFKNSLNWYKKNQYFDMRVEQNMR